MLELLGRRFRILFAAAAAMSLTSTAAMAATDSMVTRADLDAANKLAESYDQAPPFSFKYNGKSSAELLPKWTVKSQDQALDGDRTQHVVTWTDPTGLTARMVGIRYKDFPAIEWIAYLKNEGPTDSKKIDDLQGIDANIGHAPNAPGDRAKRPGWSAGKNFPTESNGGTIEVFRGWVANWKPMAKGVDGRFDTQGQAPWVSPDPKGDGDSVLMMPAQGIGAASDAPGSGKSPAIAFRSTVDGLYRVTGKVALTTNTGDGVEWLLHNFDNVILATGALNHGESGKFDRVVYLHAGEHVALTMHSRTTPDGDLCRVTFKVVQLTSPVAGDVIVHAEKGSDARDMDYQPLPIGMAPGESVALESAGGRGSDGMTIPYFNFEMPDASACLAIGWPGQWAANFSRNGSDVHVTAGQEKVHLVLHPGEEIRTPLIAIVAYTGDDVQRGQNIWRRWMVAHNIPRVDGKPVGPFVGANSSHQTAEMIKANEANQIGFIDAYAKRGLKIDYWWMDAGWYENDGTWVNTGTWKVDRKRFPNGLRAISDHIHEMGGKTIVWFEPERVTPNSELYNEHPDFLLNGIADLNSPTAGLVAVRGENNLTEPCIVYNTTDLDRVGGTIHWQPKQVTLHPGAKGEYAVARFTVPEDGKYNVVAKFGQADPNATTDDHVNYRTTSLFKGELSPKGSRELNYKGVVNAKKGETIDFAVGWGSNKTHSFDMTSVAATLTVPSGKKYDLAGDFRVTPNPNGVWTYGSTSENDLTQVRELVLFTRREASGSPNGWCLLNLGNPDALKWITDRIDSIIKSEGIDIYRQDFNIEPLNYWRGADTADREGITENLYIHGYLKYWDALRERNPKIYIDSCASGGRRNDLETMRRSTPFLRSDRLFAPTGQQSHSYGIFQWIPLNGTGTLVGKSAISTEDFGNKVDSYLFRSDISSVFILASDILNDAFDYGQFRTLLQQYRDISPCYLGDYYPLTESSLDDTKWIGWQFNVADKGQGFVQAFRRPQAGESTTNFKLYGLDKNATYTIFDVDHPEQKKSMTGAQLTEAGLDVQISSQPGAAIIRYSRQGSGK